MLTKTNFIEETNYHFCRLSEITSVAYNEMLFTCGCKYAETFCQKNNRVNWKRDVNILLSSSLFWNWWKYSWSLKINELIKKAGVNTNTANINKDMSLFLSAGFEELTHFSPSDWNYINPGILNQLNIKVHEKQSLLPYPLSNSTGTGKESRKKSGSFKLRNTNFRKQRGPIA
ncbi:hypothetical protein O2K51_05185 [Apibacter raozihei]|uniref:hypothetical protein n=1 Tax=Apibacter TaxID=1778601 RepID=UPI000FE3E45A|nr:MULTISPECIES: hypothetical protein [Apibacter]